MTKPGFNIKIKRVHNGYTVHFSKTGVPQADDDHSDYIAVDESAVRRLVASLTEDALGIIERG